MASEITKKQALKALNGMKQIVKNEMLVRGNYVTDVEVPQMENSICGGRKYCAVGSLWAGAGIKPEIIPAYEAIEVWELPGVHWNERARFLYNRHGLRLAYKALNEAAEQHIEKNNLRDERKYFLDTQFDAPIEELFEGYVEIDGVYLVDHKDLLNLIKKAEKIVTNA